MLPDWESRVYEDVQLPESFEDDTSADEEVIAAVQNSIKQLSYTHITSERADAAKFEADKTIRRILLELAKAQARKRALLVALGEAEPEIRLPSGVIYKLQ